jgi:hypothetical protein
LSHDKAGELRSLGEEVGVASTLCDFHAVRAIGDRLAGHGLSELAAVCAVAFKCVRRSLTNTTLNAAVLAFDKFVRLTVGSALSYLSQ